MTDLVVRKAGWATTVQDEGRPGYAAIGVPASGALDEPLRQLLNRLVGNPADAAVLETLGGLEVATSGPAVVATSADLAPRTVGRRRRRHVEPAAGALWGYLAVRGGLDVRPVLGSRSTETRSGLGPPAPVAGARLPIGADPATAIVVDVAPRAAGTDRPIGDPPRSPRRVVHDGCARAARDEHVDGLERREPRRRPPRRPGAVAIDRRRAAERGDAAGRHPGPARRSPRRDAGRPPDDRRVSRHRRRRPGCGARSSPSAGPAPRSGSASYSERPRESFRPGGSNDRPSPLRHLHGAVPPSRREPDARHRARPRPRRPPRQARVGRGLDRRAPLGRHRDHRLARDLHRRRSRAHPAHQARHRRDQRGLPQPVHGRRACRAARPHDPRPVHARRRARLAADRRDHARPRPDRDPAAARGGRSTSSCSCSRRRSPSRARPRRGTSSTPACTCGRTRTRCSTSPSPAVASPSGPRLAGQLRRRAAVHRRDAGGRVRRPRPALGRHGGARRDVRHRRRPGQVAPRRHDAHRRDQGAGRGGRRARDARVVRLLPAHRRLPADGRRLGRRGAGHDRLRQRLRARLDRHGRHGVRADRTPPGAVRRVRLLHVPGPRVGEPGGHEAQLRADRPARVPRVPGPGPQHAGRQGPRRARAGRSSPSAT